MANDYERGVADGLEDAATLVEQLWHAYTAPAAKAALGAAMDELRKRAATARGLH